mgnify:CR=1 FL=1
MTGLATSLLSHYCVLLTYVEDFPNWIDLVGKVHGFWSYISYGLASIRPPLIGITILPLLIFATVPICIVGYFEYSLCWDFFH